MKSRIYLILPIAFGLQCLLLASPRPASAIKTFQKEFNAMYLKEESQDPAELEFAKTVAAAKCNLCHKGKKKKDLNAYGLSLAELLDKKKDKKDLEKIKASLKKVETAKSNPDDSSSPTFIELISAKELPGGDTK